MTEIQNKKQVEKKLNDWSYEKLRNGNYYINRDVPYITDNFRLIASI